VPDDVPEHRPDARADTPAKAGPDRLLTPQEAAEFLNVSRATVLRWARGGLLPSVTIPSGRRRFRRVDLLGARAPADPVEL
jgi:excisionase family DNA binding protein